MTYLLNVMFEKYKYVHLEHIQIQDLCYDRTKIYEDNFIIVEKILYKDHVMIRKKPDQNITEWQI